MNDKSSVADRATAKLTERRVEGTNRPACSRPVGAVWDLSASPGTTLGRPLGTVSGMAVGLAHRPTVDDMNNAFANDKIKMEDINYHCSVHWTAELHAPFLIHAAFASPPTGRTCELIDICGHRTTGDRQRDSTACRRETRH
jgi:hypothetical protein